VIRVAATDDPVPVAFDQVGEFLEGAPAAAGAAGLSGSRRIARPRAGFCTPRVARRTP